MSTPSTKRLITVDDLYRLVDVRDVQLSPDGTWIAYVHVAIDRVQDDYRQTIWAVPAAGGNPIQLTRGPHDTQPRWSPDGTALAFTRRHEEHNQIHVMRVTTPGGEARALTALPHGASAPAWSPDGRQIAFLARRNATERAAEDRGDAETEPEDALEARHRKERRAEDEKLALDPRRITRLPYREGTSFRDDRYKQVYVIDAHDPAAEPRRLTDQDADYGAPRWSPDGTALYTSRTVDPARDEPSRWESLFRLDLASGEETQLTDETFIDWHPIPAPDGATLAYLRTPMHMTSRANTRLAILPAGGGGPLDLTQEMDRAVHDFAWAPDSATLLFTATDHGDRRLYRVSVADSEVLQVIGGTLEITSLDVSTAGDVAYAATTPLTPPEVFIQARGASERRQLTHHNQPLLDEVIVQEAQAITFAAPDGVTIQGWYLLPVGYEEGQPYPLLHSIHGGPHVMFGPSYKTMWHEWQVQAAQGYVVFWCNPRGSDGYGGEFRDGLYARGWGFSDMDDHSAGLEAMLATGAVDPARQMVTGGSYGGFMTAWLVGHTDRYRAAVAQRGVYHLMGFYGTTDIPGWLHTQFGVEPWEDPQKLWQNSPVAYAEKIDTPLLLIHSENDFRVPVPDAELLFALLKRLGKTVELLRFPRDGHELSRSGEPRHRVERLNAMLDWLARYGGADAAAE